MRLFLSLPLLALTAPAAIAAPPKVIADIPVVGSLVQSVMGDLAEVSVLMDDGADPHHYQMRPSDARNLQSAELLVWVGPELTPWLERASSNLGSDTALRLLAIDGTHLRDYGDGPEIHDHAHEDHEGHAHAEHESEDHEGHDHADHDDHGHDDHADHDHDHDHEEHADEGHDHEGHDHSSGTDPHAWLDPLNAQLWLKEIARELAEKDPENAETYRANAAATSERIAELNETLTAQLRPLADKPFVVFHDAYGYFTDHFGLTPAIAVSLGDASDPSAAHLSKIRDQIADSGVTCAFPEYGHSTALVERVIEGSGATIGDELSPAGRGLDGGAALYEAALTNMADTLTKCLK